MNLDLSQIEWDELKLRWGESPLLLLCVIATIADHKDKRMTTWEIQQALGGPAKTPKSDATWLRKWLVKFWEDGWLRRYECRRLGRRRKRMKILGNAKAYWSLTEKAWITMTRLRAFDEDKIQLWMAEDDPERP